VVVLVAPVPAMVPPVARITTLGSLVGGLGWAGQSANRQRKSANRLRADFR
jgi:hypothetical protein